MEAKRLKLLREIIIVCIENHTKHSVRTDSRLLTFKQVVHIITIVILNGWNLTQKVTISIFITISPASSDYVVSSEVTECSNSKWISGELLCGNVDCTEVFR
jgi:hypothetical protein